MQANAPPIFNRGPSLTTRLAFFFLLSVVLLVADARFRYLEDIRAGVSVVLFPFQEVAALPADLMTRTGDFFVAQATLSRENEQLKRERILAGADLQRMGALQAENAHLRTLVNASPIPGRTRVVAEILYESRDPFTRKIVIDRGSRHDMQAGLAVVDHRGVLGQVTRVFPFVSEVSMLTDKSQSIPIQNVRSGVRAVTFGLGHDGAVELRFVPASADFQVGDVLVTSGIDGTFPAGLPVAKVARVEPSSASFARIHCTPLAGVANFTRVVVLGPGAPHPENPMAPDAAGTPGAPTP